MLDLGPLRGGRIGLGLAALGRPGYINLGHAEDLRRDYEVESMARRAAEVLDAAWNAGVRYFDAARSYGRAEDFLGSWLRRAGRDPRESIVASKWGYTYTAGWSTSAEKHEVKDHSLAVLLRQRKETRERLGAHLDLYQIHSATLESGVLEDGGVLGELGRIREDGLAIGLSVSGPRQGDTVRKALAIEIDGRRLFDAVQATWNLLEPSAGGALAEAHRCGLAVIIKEGVANGRLTERNRVPEFAAQRALLERIAGRLGCTFDALALAAVLAQPWASVALSGAATLAQLRANLRAVEVEWSAELEVEVAALAEPPDEYWQRRAALAWN